MKEYQIRAQRTYTYTTRIEADSAPVALNEAEDETLPACAELTDWDYQIISGDD